MGNTTDKRQTTLESLRVDLADLGDEIWSEDTIPNFDDEAVAETAKPAQSQDAEGANDTGKRTAANASPDRAGAATRRPEGAPRRPARATKFRTREEIFEHRMAVMAHRRAQLEAHRNRQTRNWFAFTCALLFIGAGGLGGFYYKANDWKFLSSYSFGKAEIPAATVASAPANSVTGEQYASSHFQNASAAALLNPVKKQPPVEEVTAIPVVEIPHQLEKLVEKITSEAPREPVTPAVVAQEAPAAELPAPEPVVTAAAPEEESKPEVVEATEQVAPVEVAEAAEEKKLVRIAPTASPAPEAVSNLAGPNDTAAADTTGSDWVMVPVETKPAQPEQAVASLSRELTAPKSASAATGTNVAERGEVEEAIETAVSVPPEALSLGAKPEAAEAAVEKETAKELLGSLMAKDTGDVSVLLERGDELLLLGDIVSARQLYQHAFQQGNPRAAARIGTTYDPRIFAQLGVHGLKPDSKMALDWYNKAVTAGDESARQTAQSLSAQISQP